MTFWPWLDNKKSTNNLEESIFIDDLRIEIAVPDAKTGKSSRITEKIKKKIGIDIETKPEEVTEENLAPVAEEKPAEAITTEIKSPETLKVEEKKEEKNNESPEEKK